MSTIITNIFPGRYIQGPNAFKTLPEEIKRFGPRCIALLCPFSTKVILPTIKQPLHAALDLFDATEFNNECTDEEIDRLVQLANTHKPNVLLGMGGGKALDTIKCVADKMGLPCIMCPTMASTDAPCSALSIVYTADGAVKRIQYHRKNPDVVIVDSVTVSKAPVRMIVAGMGDALATWFEAESCKIKNAPNSTNSGRPGSLTAYALARLCYDTLLEWGVQAKCAVEAQTVTPALEKIIEANTLLSGLGFESAGLAAAHAIHNGLTQLPQTHHNVHGEKVAIGLQASLFLTGKGQEIVDEVYTFCEAIGLPTQLNDIGLREVTDDELMIVAKRSLEPGDSMINEPYPIDAEAIVRAMRMADHYGKARKHGLLSKQVSTQLHTRKFVQLHCH
ncbi:unnamed protein product [Vitrella brassicaformis CCMP3155]|uniref:Alcohol dehydrogenase iron-type/glycerol dehydrogenase GldA domain-containing protein n=2 Tax=Vitrella brassicaformis TaxID=1169539 RepID=A0A0G4GFK1_VITBC|nr:unnamed protein product [Vitrella brassicaformis CCMP3155]|eukprot:CEM28074.1 unnamed protein product [Vitrella brassicaformis CCMP3155]